MKITRTSPVTGVTHTLEIDCTLEQLETWKAGMLIQDAMPTVDSPLREYIKSGITPQEWIETFGRPPRSQRQRRRPS